MQKLNRSELAHAQVAGGFIGATKTVTRNDGGTLIQIQTTRH